MSVGSFSSSGGYFAISSGGENSVRVWDTVECTLRKSLTASSPLNSPCTCYSWCKVTALGFESLHVSSASKRSRKKRSNISDRDHGGDSVNLNETDPDDVVLPETICLGSHNGDIAIYNAAQNALTHILEDKSSLSITCLCLSPDKRTVFVASSDHHIRSKNIRTGSITSDWKAGKHTITSINCCSTQYLLSASRTIKLWCLKTKQKLLEFTGHANEVQQIVMVPIEPLTCNSNGDLEPADELTGRYFLSSARGDRSINTWCLNTTKPKRNSLCSFLLPDDVLAMEVSDPLPQQSSNVWLLGAITSEGQLYIFEVTLNGRRKKPMQPKLSITINSNDEQSSPLHILGLHFQNERELVIGIAYGGFVQTAFDKLIYSRLEQTTYLIRDDPSKATIRMETSVSKVVAPSIDRSRVRVNPPGSSNAPSDILPMAVLSSSSKDGLSSTTQSSPSRKKRKLTPDEEMDFEERLRLVGLQQPPTTESQTSKPSRSPDALVLLLSQSLITGDSSDLNFVLQVGDNRTQSKTVAQLPIGSILPLVNVLCKRLRLHPSTSRNSIRWLRATLCHHYAYLSTIPEAMEQLSCAFDMADSLVPLLSSFSRLQGKLDLLSTLNRSAEEASTETVSKDLADQPAVVTYCDESSDESMDLDIDTLTQEINALENTDTLSSDSDSEPENNDVNDPGIDSDIENTNVHNDEDEHEATNTTLTFNEDDSDELEEYDEG